MKKLILLACIFLMTSCISFGQSFNANEGSVYIKTNPIKSAPKNVILGGEISATFGDYTEIWISPMLGYFTSPQALIGLTVTYKHSWDKLTSSSASDTTIQSNSLGGSIFFDYFPVTELYLKTEFAYANYKSYTTQNTDENTGVPFIFLGLGYNKMVSPNVYLNAGLKVDVLNDVNSPFDDFTPFFEVGVGFGI